MPELPEVETNRKLWEENSLNQKILSIHIDPDPIFFEKQTPNFLKKNLQNQKIINTGRLGKYFWIDLENNYSLLMHLGMTGWSFVYHHQKDRPRFLKLELKIKKNLYLGLTNKRKFGRCFLVKDIQNHPRLKKLGPDAYHSLPIAQDLFQEFQKRKIAIKALLLNQSLMTGVGNWIADEVLYQAKINPHRKASSLSLSEAKLIRSKIKSILNFAVKVDADDKKFPKTWLFHHRWGKNKNAQTFKGERLKFDTIGGRTTAWVEIRDKVERHSLLQGLEASYESA
jgi:formamidopyrimidine-DNA glycosylase